MQEMSKEPELKIRLKEIRKEKGLSQYELADKIGIQSSTLSRYELEQRVPNFYMAYKIAKALECPMEDLIAIKECNSIKENAKDK